MTDLGRSVDPAKLTPAVCRGCGKALPPKPAGKGGTTRQWCREACRTAHKRAIASQHRAACVRCGKALGEGSGWAGRAKALRCPECRSDLRVQRVLRMVNLRVAQSATNRDIAADLGIPLNTVIKELNRMRVIGFHVPPDPRAKFKGAAALTLREPQIDSLERALAERGIVPPNVTPTDGLSS